MYVYLPDTLRHDSRAAPDHSRKIGKRHIASAIGIAPASEHIKCRVCIKLRTAIIAGGTQIGYVSDHINGARFPALRRIAQGDVAGIIRNSNRRTGRTRSEEHTSELQSLMRISYAVFCLEKKK